MKYNIKEFAQEIRKLFPGDYEDLSDNELVRLWLSKYPDDIEKVELNYLSTTEIILEPIKSTKRTPLIIFFLLLISFAFGVGYFMQYYNAAKEPSSSHYSSQRFDFVDPLSESNSDNFKRSFPNQGKTIIPDQNKVINIQPLGYVDPQYIAKVKTSIKEFYGFDCAVLPQVDVSDDILTTSKQKYDASKILKKYNTYNYRVIVTEKQIACSCWVSPEYTCFGLARMPGKICVVSTFRLKQNTTKDITCIRIEKTILHELGHNFNLDHCTNNSQCVMYNGDGSVEQLDREKIWLCPSCQNKIKKPIFSK
jgi:archaemetzincin